tara:strand:- start:412 stop:702 length:291 start_codon:yes stop_codon:yes gene_type:complete
MDVILPAEEGMVFAEEGARDMLRGLVKVYFTAPYKEITEDIEKMTDETLVNLAEFVILPFYKEELTKKDSFDDDYKKYMEALGVHVIKIMEKMDEG